MPLSNEELRQLVGSMIQLNELLRKKRAEIKAIRDTYKAMTERVKEHSRENEIKFIRMNNSQVHVYEQVREPTITKNFLLESLSEFFSNAGGNQQLAEAATAHVMADKKAKKGGKSTWTLTMRKLAGNDVAAQTLCLDSTIPAGFVDKPAPTPRAHKRPRAEPAAVAPVTL